MFLPFLMASIKGIASFPMQKAVLLAAVATLSALSAVAPIKAEEASSTKTFEQNKKEQLKTAQTKLKNSKEKQKAREIRTARYQTRVNCIKAAKNTAALEKCQ